MAGTTNLNQVWNGTAWVTKTTNSGHVPTPANAQTLQQNFDSSPIEDKWLGLQLDADKNISSGGELGNAHAANQAADISTYSWSIVWVVAALFAVFIGIRLLKHQKII